MWGWLLLSAPDKYYERLFFVCVCVFPISLTQQHYRASPTSRATPHLKKQTNQAKDLVEGAPCTLMQKVKKEDAAKIIEKLKAEGAECELV